MCEPERPPEDVVEVTKPTTTAPVVVGPSVSQMITAGAGLLLLTVGLHLLYTISDKMRAFPEYAVWFNMAVLVIAVVLISIGLNMLFRFLPPYTR